MTDNRPNLVIFNPDSYRGDVVHHVGNPGAVTPNLDRIVADNAVSFANAFCQNPVCTPSRCSFMSGWYPHVRGHRTMSHMMHPERGDPNLLKLLKDNGYYVWWGGKNDLIPGQNGPSQYCDEYFAPGQADYARWGVTPFGDPDEDNSWRGQPDGDRYYGFLRGILEDAPSSPRADIDYARVRGALEFIERYDGDRPFCLFLPLSAPHPRYQIERTFFESIDPAKLPGRIPAPEDASLEPLMRTRIRDRQNLRDWPEERWTLLRTIYYAMCARVDHFFGQIIAALRERGTYDSTALFFFSDHGDYTGDYGLVEKTQNSFEDCLIRVPFVVKPPRDVAVRPRVTHALIELVDFAATVLDLCGIDPGYTHFGRSLRDVIAGGADEHRDAVFCEGGRLEHERHCTETPPGARPNPSSLYWPKQQTQFDNGPAHTKAAMCRTRDFTYVKRFAGIDQLYDLRHDPGETRNLVHQPAYREALVTLRNRMLDWYVETCDAVPFQGDSRGMALGGDGR